MQWITTTQILDDLKCSDNSVVWKRFSDHFYPVIFAFSKSMGLSTADAEDVTQDTIIQFLRLYRAGKFHRQKGHLSHWVFGVARNVIRDFIKKKPPERNVSDSNTRTSFWASIQDDKAMQHTWTVQWQRSVLDRCLSKVRSEVDPKTYRAFEMYAMDQQPVEQVCNTLDMTPNAVYVAKNRVLTKIRELKKRYDE